MFLKTTADLECHRGGVTGAGPPDAEVMIIGIAPGSHELNSGRPFTGQSGILLRNILEAHDLSIDQFYLTNLLCRPNTAPSLEDIIGCFPRLNREIAAVQPKLIVCLGAIVAGVFFPDRKFGDVRGSFDYHPNYNCWILSCNHPAALLHESESRANLASDLVRDIGAIKRFLEVRPDPSIRHIEYHVVQSASEAQALLDILPKDRPVAADIETDNKTVEEIDVQSDELICIGISYSDDLGNEPTFIMPRAVLDNLSWPLDVQWTWHYGTFDTQKIRKVLGINLPIAHDTLLMHNSLEERSGRHRLKPLSRQYVWADFYDDEVKGIKTNLRKAEPEKLYLYCAHDARNTRRLQAVFDPLITADGTRSLYENILMPAVNVFKEMQFRGVPISVPAAMDLMREWVPLLREKDTLLLEQVVEAGGDPNINFDSPQQLSKFLYGKLRLPRAPGGTSTATGKDILEELAGLHPFVNGLLDIRHLKKMLNTYVFGVLDDVKDTGRIHPPPLLHGTNGGRCSYSNPPINTIPRPYMKSPYGPKLRKIFAAEPGRVIVELDYKQAELWQAYFYSGDSMLGADLSTGDFHRQTAAFIHKCSPSEVESEWRSKAKNTNFGKLYRIGDAKLAKQIERSITEAHQWSQDWDNRYSTYVDWGERLFKELQETGENQTVSGRKFRYPLVLDRSILSAIYNGPIQGTSHDYILMAIIEGYWPLYDDYEAEICLDIHDAIIIHAWEHNWEGAARRMVEIMERPRFGFPQMYAEVKVGPSWGDLKEVHLV